MLFILLFIYHDYTQEVKRIKEEDRFTRLGKYKGILIKLPIFYGSKKICPQFFGLNKKNPNYERVKLNCPKYKKILKLSFLYFI